ncbi:MAG: recombinase family protein [Candidatus Uhrbacteria bacterium]|nr:recombinase family protein [Candidatus Uhrbacteria bacterium]
MSVIIYARVSTEEQAETDLSIPAQIRAMQAYAAGTLNKPIVQEFQDVASGRSMKGRSGLLAAIKFASLRKEVDTFLVHRIDRLSRDIADYHVIKATLAKHGIRLVSVVEHTDNTPAGELMENIFASFAQFTSAKIGFEVRKSLEERLRRGEWTAQAPVGYLLKQKKLVPDPARARFVREAFRRYATETISVSQLARELAEIGFVGKHGKPIAINRIYTMLHNPIYIGRLKTSFGEFPGKHQPLIDENVFEICQKRLNHGRGKVAPRQAQHFPLAGQLNCPTCGRVLIGEHHIKKSGREYRYYRCHNTKCHYSIHADEVEANMTIIGDIPPKVQSDDLN